MSEYVTYEQFGAIGDGKADDTAAIVRAHAYANEHNLPVRTKSDATYYIGTAATPARIMTDTDWNTSRFIIDDTVTEDFKKDIFVIPPRGEWTTLPIPPLSAGQTALDLAACGITLEQDMYVDIVSDERMQYIRFGGNRDSGSPQTDSFILTKEGKLLSGINWDYTKISKVRAVAIDSDPLSVRGGHFTTIANQAESKYNYYGRGINIIRSNTTVENVYHTVTGEIDHGAPYRGFFSFTSCAYVTLKNCHVCGHKTYWTIGSAGTPVGMGSYDINCGNAIDIRFIGVRQDNICDRTRWGVFGSNFCKQITFDDCVISRTDAHCGLRDYTIRNSVIGWMGTNTIGFGEMLMENCTCFCDHIVGFRPDYGCTWQGNLTLRNITWVPNPGNAVTPVMLTAHNNGQHDFGYPCALPTSITIENVTVVDTNTPNGYPGVRIFNNFDGDVTMENRETHTEPYPLKRPEKITVRGLRTVSGKPIILCDNPALLFDTEVVIED